MVNDTKRTSCDAAEFLKGYKHKSRQRGLMEQTFVRCFVHRIVISYLDFFHPASLLFCYISKAALSVQHSHLGFSVEYVHHLSTWSALLHLFGIFSVKTLITIYRIVHKNGAIWEAPTDYTVQCVQLSMSKGSLALEGYLAKSWSFQLSEHMPVIWTRLQTKLHRESLPLLRPKCGLMSRKPALSSSQEV